MLRRLLFLLIALASLGSTRAQQVVITPLPSASASLNVTLSNAGAVAVAAPEWIASPLYFVQTTMSATPPCVLTQTSSWVRLATPALAPGASVSCSITYTRSAASPIPSSNFAFTATNGDPALLISPPIWVVGSVVDLSVRVEPVMPLPRPGATEALFRVVLSNPSDAAVSGVEFGRCSEPGPSPFRVDASIPGGCSDADFGLLCFISSEFNFALPPVSARGESSCLIRASDASGLIAGESSWLGLESYSAESDAGYWVADPSYDNDGASFAIGFFAATSIPALQPWSLLALVLGIALFALRAQARSTVGRKDAVVPGPRSHHGEM